MINIKNNKTHTVSKFRRSRCKNCNIIFPLSKGIHILNGEYTEIYCSLHCLPQGNREILNCSVCSLVVEQASIFCSICDRWVHQDCSKLNDEALLDLTNNSNDWVCFPCKKAIFPCISDISEAKITPFKPPFWFNNKKCLKCKSKTMQKGCLTGYYKNKIVYFCSIACSSHYSIEYLDCSECGKYVKSSKKGASICCDKCNTWVHKKYSNLTNTQFKKMQCSDDNWYCSKCKIILNETEIENTDTENNSSHHAKIKPLKLKCNYCPNVGSEQAGWYFVHSNKNNKNYSFCTKTCFESHAGKRISDYEINNCSVCMKKIGDRVESIFASAACFGCTGSA